eukprot:SAG31_NODE_4010_length_3667_cov_2.004484_1_plen_90_part_00
MPGLRNGEAAYFSKSSFRFQSCSTSARTVFRRSSYGGSQLAFCRFATSWVAFSPGTAISCKRRRVERRGTNGGGGGGEGGGVGGGGGGG